MSSTTDGMGGVDDLQEIGPWTEIKHEIIREYAEPYSRILSTRESPKLHHVYVDAFAGPGRYRSRRSGEEVSGSPQIALEIDPPFREYHFIDLAGEQVERLRRLAEGGGDVHVHQGDCNVVLVNEVLPRIRWADYRRGLCILDPYGMHLDWSTIKAVADLGTTEIFLNFPIMDINRNALRTEAGQIDPKQAERMTDLWGDDSWRDGFYRQHPQQRLWEEAPDVKAADNTAVAEAFRQRLVDKAGFKFVPQPVAMRNSTNAVVYYLYFASHNDLGGKIVEHIFGKRRGGR